MKLARSTLVAAAILAGSAAAIQDGLAQAEGNIQIAQAAPSCVITVAYRDEKRETKTKTTCVKGGALQCNTLPNNFCAPADHPDIVSRTCEVVRSCPDTPK